MTYIEIKLIKGRQYKYKRKCIWKGGKSKNITMKYLGPVEPVHGIRKKRKTNASVYVRPFREKEKIEIIKALSSSNTFTRDRAKMVLLSSEKFFARQIAEKTGCEARKVRLAIRIFNQEGLKALERKKAKGAEPKFTDWDKKSVLIHFSKGPREFGYHYTEWTLPRFRKHLMEKNVVDSICIETVRQIIVGAGAKLTKSKRWQYSPDKNFLKKREQ